MAYTNFVELGTEPVLTKGKGEATTGKLATPIRLDKDAFLFMLRMAESKKVAKDLAKNRGGKIFEEMKRNTGTVVFIFERHFGGKEYTIFMLNLGVVLATHDSRLLYVNLTPGAIGKEGTLMVAAVFERRFGGKEYTIFILNLEVVPATHDSRLLYVNLTPGAIVCTLSWIFTLR
ncbi:hypothetical protein RSAG8_02422, partial [Rhizoctonia solani AG-8 WAC10335]